MSLSPEVNAFLERRRRRFRIFSNETIAALVLVLATVVALLWANFGPDYEHFWETVAGFDFGFTEFELTLHAWVDEFLMTLFFFVIGLDVRRELSIGDLRVPGRAILPVAAAIGGLIVPAAVFLLFTQGTPEADAWGTVISTDTAFALGMLALIGPRNAPRLRLFLLAIAVVDDIGALLVIAVFYTADLNVVALGVAVIGLLCIFLLQRAGVWRVPPYLVVGLVVWYAVHESGVHATLAGVLIALLMPVYDTRRRDVGLASELFRLFRQSPSPIAAQVMRDSLVHAIPLNQRLTTALQPYVSFLVVPLFALANAGIILSSEAVEGALESPLTWGIIVGLVLGKLVGITGTSLLVMRFVPKSRLPGLDFPRIAGIGALTGMGFTISLLVVGLALDDPLQQAEARIGVLMASIVALGAAFVIFRLGDRFAPLEKPAAQRLPRPVDVESDHIFGDPDAPVTLVAYAAINDAYRHGPAESLRMASEDRARDGRMCVVFRHYARTPEEVFGGLCLEAAARQGRFGMMHDALLKAGGDPDMDSALDIARRIGLDVESFRRRVEQAVDEAQVNDDTLDLGDDPEDTGPVYFLQGERIPSGQNSWHLARRLEAATTAAEKRSETGEPTTA